MQIVTTTQEQVEKEFVADGKYYRSALKRHTHQHRKAVELDLPHTPEDEEEEAELEKKMGFSAVPEPLTHPDFLLVNTQDIDVEDALCAQSALMLDFPYMRRQWGPTKKDGEARIVPHVDFCRWPPVDPSLHGMSR